MRAGFASGDVTIVTIYARADDLRVIDCIYRLPRHRIVACIARVLGVDMGRRFTAYVGRQAIVAVYTRLAGEIFMVYQCR